MNLDIVSFPALLIADDGWVELLDRRDRLDLWNALGIRKYKNRRVILYDHSGSVWQVESIAPREPLGFTAKLVHRISNSKLPVQIQIQQIVESPLEQVKEILRAAIDADDDILTQNTEPDELKSAVGTATSYDALVGILQGKGAI